MNNFRTIREMIFANQKSAIDYASRRIISDVHCQYDNLGNKRLSVKYDKIDWTNIEYRKNYARNQYKSINWIKFYDSINYLNSASSNICCTIAQPILPSFLHFVDTAIEKHLFKNIKPIYDYSADFVRHGIQNLWTSVEHGGNGNEPDIAIVPYEPILYSHVLDWSNYYIPVAKLFNTKHGIIKRKEDTIGSTRFTRANKLYIPRSTSSEKVNSINDRFISEKISIEPNIDEYLDILKCLSPNDGLIIWEPLATELLNYANRLLGKKFGIERGVEYNVAICIHASKLNCKHTSNVIKNLIIIWINFIQMETTLLEHYFMSGKPDKDQALRRFKDAHGFTFSLN